MSTYTICRFSNLLLRSSSRFNLYLRNPNIRLYTSHPKSKGIGNLAFKGMVVGALAGTFYAGWEHFSSNKEKDHQIHEKSEPLIIDNLPQIKLTRKIINPKDDSGLELILFQYQTCPFCCKVRAFLDYSGLNYGVVEVDAVLRQSIKWSPYKKVPILLVKINDDKYIQLNDSSMIISTIASYLADKSQDILELAKFYPNITYFDDKGKKQSEIMNKYFLMFQDNIPSNLAKENLDEERKWRSWADEKLVHLISPNVYRTKEESLQTFEWFSEIGEWTQNFPSWERNLMVYVGAYAMWGISKRLKKRHQLTDDVRSHLYEACELWMKELSIKKTSFIGGAKPNLADLAVFGILNSMEGCLAFKDSLENTNIGSWFYAMKMLVDQNRGAIQN